MSEEVWKHEVSYDGEMKIGCEREMSDDEH